MRKYIFIAVALFMASGWGWSQMNNTGKYALKCGFLTRWGTDFITIDKMDDKKVSGKIGIDWSIGPEARIPFEWEKFYEMDYSAKLSKDGQSFSFTVTVGKRMTYQFTLYFLWVDKPVLTGFVNIKPLKKEFGKAMTVGAFAQLIKEE